MNVPVKRKNASVTAIAMPAAPIMKGQSGHLIAKEKNGENGSVRNERAHIIALTRSYILPQISPSKDAAPMRTVF